MKVISNLSMRRKIVLIIMTVCAVSLLVASAVFVITDRMNARQSAVQNLRTLTKFITANNSAAILFNDKAAAEENLGFLKHQTHIQAAALYGDNGKRFAVYVKPGVNVTFPEPGMQPENIFFWKNHIDLITPIIQDNQQIGHAYVRSDIKQVEERLFWYLGIVILVMVASLLIAFLLSARLQRFIKICKL